jgi:hypothetical protein
LPAAEEMDGVAGKLESAFIAEPAQHTEVAV